GIELGRGVYNRSRGSAIAMAATSERRSEALRSSNLRRSQHDNVDWFYRRPRMAWWVLALPQHRGPRRAAGAAGAGAAGGGGDRGRRGAAHVRRTRPPGEPVGAHAEGPRGQ